MTARFSGSRNIRGFGLPACGFGVTVPTSTKPKPSANSASICAPFLSSPAARPTGLGKLRFITLTGNDGMPRVSSGLSPVR